MESVDHSSHRFDVEGLGVGQRRLHFLERTQGINPWREAAENLLKAGHTRIALHGLNADGVATAAQLRDQLGSSALVDEAANATATLLLGDDADQVSAALLEHVDTPRVIVAPITERYFRNLPLFLISIPKAGTHLLFQLAQALGYAWGGSAPHRPVGGSVYYVMNSNAHTTTRAFFQERTQAAPFGNRTHPFLRSPALFNYRNPLDILVSEASYYHLDGKSPLALILSSLDFEERIAKLIDDPQLMGSIRDRVLAFAAWLDCSNVIPVSFEEMAGDGGGGSDQTLEDLIWSLQLKLHIPGAPHDIRAAMARQGPTFREGRIGGHVDQLPNEAMTRLAALPQDFMRTYGYDSETPVDLPAHALRFRRRPLCFSKARADETPILFEQDYLGYNVIAYRGRFYAVSIQSGPLDLTSLPAAELEAFLQDDDLRRIKAEIALRASIESDATVAAIKAIAAEHFEARQSPLRDNLAQDAANAITAKLHDRLQEELRKEVEALLDERLGALEATLGQSLRETLAPELEAILRERLAVALRTDLTPPLQERLARQLPALITPAIEAALSASVSAMVQAAIAQAKVGAVEAAGSFLGFNLFRRADGVIGIDQSIGAVDPRQPDLPSRRGVVAARDVARLWIKILYRRYIAREVASSVKPMETP